MKGFWRMIGGLMSWRLRRFKRLHPEEFQRMVDTINRYDNA